VRVWFANFVVSVSVWSFATFSVVLEVHAALAVFTERLSTHRRR